LVAPRRAEDVEVGGQHRPPGSPDRPVR
jgi:hypothetical protein